MVGSSSLSPLHAGMGGDICVEKVAVNPTESQGVGVR